MSAKKGRPTGGVTVPVTPIPSVPGPLGLATPTPQILVHLHGIASAIKERDEEILRLRSQVEALRPAVLQKRIAELEEALEEAENASSDVVARERDQLKEQVEELEKELKDVIEDLDEDGRTKEAFKERLEEAKEEWQDEHLEAAVEIARLCFRLGASFPMIADVVARDPAGLAAVQKAWHAEGSGVAARVSCHQCGNVGAA